MDLENMFRPGSTPELTPTADSVSAQLPEAPLPEHKIKPFSAHQLAARAPGARQLPEHSRQAAVKPDFPEQGRDCAEARVK